MRASTIMEDYSGPVETCGAFPPAQNHCEGRVQSLACPFGSARDPPLYRHGLWI
jgi:hypothetical protein